MIFGTKNPEEFCQLYFCILSMTPENVTKFCEMYRVAQKVVHFSTRLVFGTVQDKMKRISPKCS